MTTDEKAKRQKFMLAGVLCCVLGALCMYYSVWLFPIYVPFFLAASVIGILAMARDRVWSGLGLFLTASIVPGVLFLLLLIVPSGREIQWRIDEWLGTNEDYSTTDQQISIGETAITPTYEVKVATVRQRKRVGSFFRKERAVDGAVYLVVTWYYKNISSRAMLSREQPTMTLLSPNGATYTIDVPANKMLSGDSLARGLTASSVNPGVQMRRVDAFEVPKGNVGGRGWQAIISADERVAVQLDE